MPQQGIRRWGGRALLSAGLIAALFTGYKLSQSSAQKTITVMINDQAYQLDTDDAPTVQTALDQAHIVLDSADEIAPDLTAPVVDGTMITIWKAHAIALEIDGLVIDYRTQLTHPLDILTEYGVTLDQEDVIRVNGRAVSLDDLRAETWFSPAGHIAVTHAVTISIIERTIDGEHTLTLQTTQTDVARALAAAEIDLYLADRVTPAFDTRITPDLIVEITRSVPITVTVDGQTLVTRAAGPTVGDALAGIRVALIGEDYADPAEDMPLTPDLVIRVVRVTEDLIIERVTVPFNTQFQPDASLPRGEHRTIQAGQLGEREQWQRVRYENGQETTRTLIDEYLILPPMPQLVLYGTGSSKETPDSDE